MTKLLYLAVLTASLAACSDMGMHSSSMGNSGMSSGADMQHSTDSAAAKHDNPAAVSPGGK